MKTVLVTGASGFIGGYVVEELENRGYEPVIFDTRFRPEHAGRKVALGDIRDATTVMEAASRADGIIHLAGVLGTQETIKNPRPAAETNILGGLNVLEAAVHYNIPMVNIAVGNWWMANAYSISKNTVERFIEMYNRYRGGRINIVRLVNAYGPRQLPATPFGPARVRKVTPAFVCRALTGQPIEVYGDGEQISDMVWVGDGAEALVNALESAANGRIFSKPIELGPREHTTVKHFAELIIAEANRLGIEGSTVNHLPMRPGEDPGATVIADVDTLELIGMSPDELLPLQEGVRRTVQWYYENWLPGYTQ